MTSDPPELELQGFVSCVTWVLGALSGPKQQQQALLTAEPSARLLNPRLFMLHKGLHHQVALKVPSSGWTVQFYD